MSDLQNQAILTNHQANQFAQIDGADIATFRFLTQHTKEVQNGNSILLPKAVLPVVLTGCTDQISLEAAVIFLKPASFIASYLSTNSTGTKSIWHSAKSLRTGRR